MRCLECIWDFKYTTRLIKQQKQLSAAIALLKKAGMFLGIWISGYSRMD